jgi:hypothetical protein
MPSCLFFIPPTGGSAFQAGFSVKFFDAYGGTFVGINRFFLKKLDEIGIGFEAVFLCHLENRQKKTKFPNTSKENIRLSRLRRGLIPRHAS